eukprot:14803385-Heterocapsa_arctica.AAC.1
MDDKFYIMMEEQFETTIYIFLCALRAPGQQPEEKIDCTEDVELDDLQFDGDNDDADDNDDFQFNVTESALAQAAAAPLAG